MFVPNRPKIYHIVHVDRLESIVSNGYLWSDAEARRRQVGGTMIGMDHIKERRLYELILSSQPGLYVGQCVPFYFCPRSIMLYVIHVRNPALTHQTGQGSIVHLEADLHRAVAWADAHGKRWAFTTSNAGAYIFDDYSDLAQLNRIDWDAVRARYWSECKDAKQAEFLMEHSFPWELVSCIGVRSVKIRDKVSGLVQSYCHRPPVQVRPNWYY